MSPRLSFPKLNLHHIFLKNLYMYFFPSFSSSSAHFPFICFLTATSKFAVCIIFFFHFFRFTHATIKTGSPFLNNFFRSLSAHSLFSTSGLSLLCPTQTPLSALSGIGFLVAVPILSFGDHGFSMMVPILSFGWFWVLSLRSILSFGGDANLDFLLILGVTLSLSLIRLWLWFWCLILSFRRRGGEIGIGVGRSLASSWAARWVYGDQAANQLGGEEKK